MKRYRKFRSADGRVRRVEMTWEEVQEHDNYWITVAVTPLVMLAVFAAAAGII